MYLRCKVSELGIGSKHAIKDPIRPIFDWNFQVWNYFTDLIMKYEAYAHIAENQRV